MSFPPFPRPSSRRQVWLLCIVFALPLILLAGRLSPRSPPTQTDQPAIPDTAASPPWRHGPADARFTLILYADLECPYCKAYFPVLKQWVDRHPEARLQWHHLPLPMHEPAASTLACLAECVGEQSGQAAYWDAVSWIYQHTRSDGQGLPANARYPGLTPKLQACLDGESARATVQAQARESARDGIAATPTLRVRDERSGQSLLLHGPVEGDALLSALDFLDASPSPIPSPVPEGMSAADAGDMPR